MPEFRNRPNPEAILEQAASAFQAEGECYNDRLARELIIYPQALTACLDLETHQQLADVYRNTGMSLKFLLRIHNRNVERVLHPDLTTEELDAIITAREEDDRIMQKQGCPIRANIPV